MKQRLWHSTNFDTVQQTNGSRGTHGFTKAACRRMAMYDSRKPGANFTCPKCHVAFYLTYGKFGIMKVFQDPTHYCRDCAECDAFQAM